MVPIYCSNDACREVVHTEGRKRQIVGEVGRVGVVVAIRLRCRKCGKLARYIIAPHA
jgi:hypothetical protein